MSGASGDIDGFGASGDPQEVCADDMDQNMVGMLNMMLAVAGAWWLGILATAGIGLSFLRLARAKVTSAEDYLSSFWIGWALVLSALQLWHLVLPVDATTVLALLAVGLLGGMYNIRTVVGHGAPPVRRLAAFLGFGLLFSVWLANRAMSPLGDYDAALYHLSTLRWISSFPIVPGLGNLHGRLAFNSSYYLYMALLNVGPWADRLYSLAPGMLLLAAGLHIPFSVLRLIQRDTAPQAHDLVRVALIPLYLWQIYFAINRTSADVPVVILGIVLFVELSRLVLDGGGGRQGSLSAFMILFLAAAMISLKLSAAAFAGSAVLVATIALFIGGRANHERMPWTWLLVPPILALVTWSCRGVALSGYPAYPSSFAAVDVDWRIPAESVREEARWVMSWARAPGQQPDEVLDDWEWLRPWGRRMLREGLFVFVVPSILSLLFGLAAIARLRQARRLPFATLALVPPVASLIFWFLTAPDLRFIGAAPWLMTAGATVLALDIYGWAGSRRSALWILAVSVAVAFGMYLTSEKLVDPGSEEGFYPLPTAVVEAVTLPSGLTVNVPVGTDLCWDAPLPCSPYPPPELRLRVHGALASGFTVAPP